MITAAALLFLVGLVIAERLLDDLLILLEAAGALACPRRRVRILLARFLGALVLALVLAGAGLTSLRACLVGHGHLPGACPDLADIPHLCFEALAFLGDWRGAPLWALAVGTALIAAAFTRRLLRPISQEASELHHLDPGDSPVTIVRDVSTAAGCRVEGLLRPRIVVPADFEERFSYPERRAALLHEIGHIQGRDPWLHQMTLLYRNVLFLLPGPRRLTAALHAALEERADDWAVRVGGADPEALARSIARAAGVPVPHGQLGLSGSSKVELLYHRIGRLQGRAGPPRRVPWASLLRLTWLAMLMATGWVQLHCIVEALA